MTSASLGEIPFRMTEAGTATCTSRRSRLPRWLCAKQDDAVAPLSVKGYSVCQNNINWNLGQFASSSSRVERTLASSLWAKQDVVAPLSIKANIIYNRHSHSSFFYPFMLLFSGKLKGRVPANEHGSTGAARPGDALGVRARRILLYYAARVSRRGMSSTLTESV